ncbi:MAG: hypothetical protein RMJ96_05300 [Candidatus Bipolaricaulota bacterium]|nr:hypothetical protein [Candidatus Bipolaricaulota bacterium]MDW8329838.1 hypothetical protein [Candidatus Bipolaricaulota bacterium]
MGFLLQELARATFTAVPGRALIALALGALLLATAGLAALAARDESGGRLMVLFEPGISNEQINAIYRQVREWESLSEVRYVEGGLGRALSVVVRRWSERAQVEEALRALAGVAKVESGRRSALGMMLLPWGGVVFAGLGMMFGALALMVLVGVRRAWRGELEILSLSGVSMGMVRGALMVWGMGWGGGSALVGLLLLGVVRAWGQASGWLPEFEQSGALRYAALVMVGLGGLSGGLAGGIGALTLRR